MSADLFAEFGPFSGSKLPSSPPNQQSPGNKNNSSNNNNDDPFAFLSSALSQPTPQRSQPPLPQSRPQSQAWSTFSSPIQPTSTASGWGTSGWGSAATAVPPPAAAATTQEEAADDDDTWGDFEDASPATPSGPSIASVMASPAPAPSMPSWPASRTAPAPQPQPQPSFQPKTRVARASTIDLMTNTLIHFGDNAPKPQSTQSTLAFQPIHETRQEPPVQQTAPPVPKPARPTDPNVLFDAEDFDGTEDFDDEDDDDEFGDFETGEPSPPPVQTTTRPVSMPAARPARPAAPVAPPTALIDLLSLSDPEPSPNQPKPAVPLAATQATQNASNTQRKQPPSQLLSPLGFGSTSAASPVAVSLYPQPPKSPSFQERNPFPGLALTTPRAAEFPKEVANRTPSPVTVWPTFDPAAAASATADTADTAKPAKPAKPAVPTVDDWDAWDIGDTPLSAEPGKAATAKATATATATAAAAANDWDWDAVDTEQPAPASASASAHLPAAIAESASKSSAQSIPDNAPPPTNVPPPSILLSIFPSLLALPEEALFKPTASQPPEVRTQVLGHPKTIAFLRNYLLLVVVAARVVAGRKQRWHRDKFLSQSMSISAAGSSKGGGMKLAGVDKAQGKREDREAADVVAAWRRLVGKLRTAVATANSALAAVEAAEHKHQSPLKMPDLASETIPVVTAKNVPTAPRPCVICGLRRDERVRGVDGDDVQDSFGEWWVEHWGHRACKNFWAEHESTLRSR